MATEYWLNRLKSSVEQCISITPEFTLGVKWLNTDWILFYNERNVRMIYLFSRWHRHSLYYYNYFRVLLHRHTILSFVTDWKSTSGSVFHIFSPSWFLSGSFYDRAILCHLKTDPVVPASAEYSSITAESLLSPTRLEFLTLWASQGLQICCLHMGTMEPIECFEIHIH